MAAAEPLSVYTITPVVGFTPSNSRAKHYKIGSLLNDNESRHVEYKMGGYAIGNLEQHIGRYGSAFLNSGGGKLALGISDHGEVVGILAPPPTRNRIFKTIKGEFEKFTPPVTDDLYEIDFVPTDHRARYVLEIHIRAGRHDEIYSDKEDKVYIRRDASVQGPLRPTDIISLLTDKLNKIVEEEVKEHRDPLLAIPKPRPVT